MTNCYSFGITPWTTELAARRREQRNRRFVAIACAGIITTIVMMMVAGIATAQGAPQSGLDWADQGFTLPLNVGETEGTEITQRMRLFIAPDGDHERYGVNGIAGFRIENCVEHMGLIRWNAGHDYYSPAKMLDPDGRCRMRFRFRSAGDQTIRATVQTFTAAGLRMTTEQSVVPYPVEVRAGYNHWKWMVPTLAGAVTYYASNRGDEPVEWATWGGPAVMVGGLAFTHMFSW